MVGGSAFCALSRSVLAGLVGALMLGGLSASAAADPSDETNVDRSLWQPEWRKVSLPEVLTFAGLEGIALLVPALAPTPEQPRWRGGILFDDNVRSLLLLDSSGRKAASTFSDVGLYVLEAAPLVDAGVLTWWIRGDRDTAFQTSLMYAESYALTSVIQVGLRTAFGRQRPLDYFEHCSDMDPAHPPGPDCGKNKNDSFPSDHAAFSFTAASSLCTTHANVRSFGNVNDRLICVEAMALATSVSVARVMKDVHWSTDILAGAAVGTLSGWAVPRFLHFRGRARVEGSKGWRATLVPTAAAGSASLALIGTF